MKWRGRIFDEGGQRARARLNALLLEGLNSGEPIRADSEFWRELKREALSRLEDRKKSRG